MAVVAGVESAVKIHIDRGDKGHRVEEGSGSGHESSIPNRCDRVSENFEACARAGSGTIRIVAVTTDPAATMRVSGVGA